MMTMRKRIEVLKLLHSHLNRTRLKLLREFGEEYNAADRVSRHSLTNILMYCSRIGKLYLPRR